MRHIRYARWVKPFLTWMFVLGAVLCFWPQFQMLGWGLMLQSGYLAVGYVCIYVAEVETDLMSEAKREAGDWNRLITALTIYRTAHPETADTTQALQELNRRFWREYMQSRRYLLRSQLKNSPEHETRLEACNLLARKWLACLEQKLAEQQLAPEAEQEAQIQAMMAFRGE
jgi:hypothetical protein